MTFSELKRVQEAYDQFLKNLTRKDVIEIKYYEFPGQNGKRCFSVIGFETNEGGMHGIHYSKQRNAFYFGTVQIKGNSWNIGLAFPQVKKLPVYLKEALFEVIRTKKEKLIRKVKDAKEGVKEWI